MKEKTITIIKAVILITVLLIGVKVIWYIQNREKFYHCQRSCSINKLIYFQFSDVDKKICFYDCLTPDWLKCKKCK